MGSTTKRLCDALLNADNIDSYFDNNADRIDIGVDLSEFLEEKLKESGLTRAELFARSSINPSYGYQLLSGLRSPARDTAVQLALENVHLEYPTKVNFESLSLGVDDTQELLRMAKLGALYPRDRRDSIILFAISNGFTLPQTNELLFSHSMNGLSK